MNNEIEDFSGVIDGVVVEREREEFKLTSLKLEIFHFNSGEIAEGMPRSTSIELTSIFDYEMNERKWIKTISHRYTSFDNNLENTTDTYIEDKNDFNQLIVEIENYDLRDLKNNYYTDERPENFSRWELTYNNYFKIVWTQDNIVDELVKIMELLNIKKIIEEEINKVREKLLEINGQER